jgi:hypothetical protein
MTLKENLKIIRDAVGGTYNLAKVCWNVGTPILKRKLREAFQQNLDKTDERNT